MENVVLVSHLILTLSLIGVVLLQRSEGGGLGMGGGGGGGGLMSARGAATFLTKLTWILAIAFLVTSISLTIIAANNSSDSSVVDTLGAPATEEAAPAVPDVSDLLPPVTVDESLTPPRAE